MLTQDDQALRATRLGSSEIGAVAGLNPWMSKYDVYCVKRGLVESEQRDGLAVRVGHICEGLTAQLYEEETGSTLEPGRTLTHPEHEWVVASPDRFVVGADRLLEVKFVGWRLCAAWSREEDGVPDYVRAQVAWQMLVTGRPVCDVAALLGGEEFRIYRIEHHAELAARLLEIGERFWREHVLAGVPPSADGSESARDMLEAIFRRTRPELIRATTPAEFWVEKFIAADADLKAAERRKTEATNKLCEFIGEAEGLESAHGKFYWRRAKGDRRRTFRFFAKRTKGEVAA